MNTRLIEFKDIVDLKNDSRPMGHLTPIESLKDVPFPIKRIYYITRVPENTIRGSTPEKRKCLQTLFSRRSSEAQTCP